MNEEFTDRAPAPARARQAADVTKARNAAGACALEFLVYGDEGPRGPHAPRCVHGPVNGCARTYDPLPYPEAEPAEPSLYEDTGIAALYGLPGGEAHAWQLAGWNLAPRTTR